MNNVPSVKITNQHETANKKQFFNTHSQKCCITAQGSTPLLISLFKGTPLDKGTPYDLRSDPGAEAKL